MSHVHRLRTSDRIFFITANLRRGIAALQEGEYGRVVEALAAARRKLHFLLYGYVVMPDHGHALIWTNSPLTVSRVVQDIKWASACTLNRTRGTRGSVWQHPFWDRFIRHAKERVAGSADRRVCGLRLCLRHGDAIRHHGPGLATEETRTAKSAVRATRSPSEQPGKFPFHRFEKSPRSTKR